MATNADSLLNGTSVVISGSAITISGLTDNERAILAIALAGLYRAVGKELTAGSYPHVPTTTRIGRSNGAVEVLVVTPGAG